MIHYQSWLREFLLFYKSVDKAFTTNTLQFMELLMMLLISNQGSSATQLINLMHCVTPLLSTSRQLYSYPRIYLVFIHLSSSLIRYFMYPQFLLRIHISLVHKLWLNHFILFYFFPHAIYIELYKYILTKSMAYGSGGSTLHSQGLSNNLYPEPTQRNSSYWHPFL